MRGYFKTYVKKNYPLQLGNTPLELCVWENPAENPLHMLNLHENETTSIEAGIGLVKYNGGRFTYLHHEGSRHIRFKVRQKFLEIDPNRIFSKHGILKSLDNLNPEAEDLDLAYKAVEHFSQQISTLLIDSHRYTLKNPLIALHNNQGDGEYTIHKVKADPCVEKVSFSDTASINDFFYVVDREWFHNLSQKNCHVALQKKYSDIPQDHQDGSLSLYFGERKQSYINIEAEIGHLEEQVHMILKLGAPI